MTDARGITRQHSSLDLTNSNAKYQDPLLVSVVNGMQEFPLGDAERPASFKNQITIGDLHGNTLKLIRFLMRRNVLKMSPADYTEINRISLTESNLTKADLKRFNKIIARAEILPVGTVRLIGDEVADRVGNDYLTLKVLEKLSKSNVSVEILLSNHAVEFIEAYEKGRRFNENRLLFQAASAARLQTLIDSGVVSKKEVTKLINDYYKPSMRCISYTISEDESKISIFSHAAIGLNTIQAIANKLNVSYNDATSHDLANTIDAINVEYYKHVQANSVHTLYQVKHLFRMPKRPDRTDDQEKAPFEFLMWNRNYNDISRPANHNGYQIDFIHGHDSSEPTHDNIFNLDNILGKAVSVMAGVHNLHFNQDNPAKNPSKLTMHTETTKPQPKMPPVEASPVLTQRENSPPSPIGETKPTKSTWNARYMLMGAIAVTSLVLVSILSFGAAPAIAGMVAGLASLSPQVGGALGLGVIALTAAAIGAIGGNLYAKYQTKQEKLLSHPVAPSEPNGRGTNYLLKNMGEAKSPTPATEVDYDSALLPAIDHSNTMRMLKMNNANVLSSENPTEQHTNQVGLYLPNNIR